jgi:hypothetical protein
MLNPAVALTLPAAPEAAPAWTTLFNQPRFHALNLEPGDRTLCLSAADGEGRVIGALGGVLTAGTFVSGHSAPFGGVDLVRERETPANVALLIDDALGQAGAAGARRVRLRLPPAALGESEGLIQFTLLNRGFTVERCELNQHIDLAGIAGADAYLAALKSPARRAVRHLLADEELTFTQVGGRAAWDAAYATLAANRAARGRRLSLSRDYVERAREALGEDTVRMYALTGAAGRVVAAALVYRVRAHHDLVVAWGEDPEHGLGRSPMNLLAFRVVEAALADGVRTVDLGVSNEPGDRGAQLIPNPGLVQFKQSVLAQTQPRLTLVKELHP